MKIDQFSLFSSINVDNYHRHDFEDDTEYCQKFSVDDYIRLQGTLTDVEQIVNPRYFLMDCGGEFDTTAVQSLDLIKQGTLGLNNNISFQCITFNGSKFVAGGSSILATSTNGRNWTQLIFPSQAGTIYDILYVPETRKYILGCSEGYIGHSEDLVNWTFVNVGTTYAIQEIGYGNNTYIVTYGQNSIAYSSNLADWTITNINRTINHVAYGNRMFALSGNNGGYIYYSTDGGQSFTETQPVSLTGSLMSCFGKGEFVFIQSSTNPIWIKTSDFTGFKSGNVGEGSASALDLTYANGRYIYVGPNGGYAISTNGEKWDIGTSSANYAIQGISYGNGQYVGVGLNNSWFVFGLSGSQVIEIEPVYYDNGDGRTVFDVDLTEIAWTGCLELVIYDETTDLFIDRFKFVVLDKDDPELDDTVRIRYTNDINQFDARFINDGVNERPEYLYFDFRVEGAFRRYVEQYNNQSDYFRDQDYYPVMLSSYPYTGKTLTIGDSLGLPGWVGEKLNMIFSLKHVHIETNLTYDTYVRSDGAQVTTEVINDYYPRFIYSILLERTEKRFGVYPYTYLKNAPSFKLELRPVFKFKNSTHFYSNGLNIQYADYGNEYFAIAFYWAANGDRYISYASKDSTGTWTNNYKSGTAYISSIKFCEDGHFYFIGGSYIGRGETPQQTTSQIISNTTVKNDIAVSPDYTYGVAVSKSGSHYYKSGSSWISTTAGGTGNNYTSNGVGYFKGKFYLINGTGIYSSTTGQTWQLVTSSYASTVHRCKVFDNLIVFWNYLGPTSYYSYDGNTFSSSQVPGAGSMCSPVFFDGFYLVIDTFNGDVYRSLDYTRWENAGLDTSMVTVSGNGGYACGMATDGETLIISDQAGYVHVWGIEYEEVWIKE